MMRIGPKFGVFAGLALLLFACGGRGSPDQRTVVESYEPHRVQLLDTPALTLSRMLDMIGKANSDITLEYNNVFVCNWIGEVLFTAIQKRAEEVRKTGHALRVRLLLDYGHFHTYSADIRDGGLAGVVAAYRRHGIELKIFNPFRTYFPTAFLRLNIRDHQKRLIVDGKEIVTGGRLLGNQYFGMSEQFNRFETDLWIAGPIVQDAQKYFDELWNHELSFDQFDAKAPMSEDDRKQIESTEKCLSTSPMKPEEKGWLAQAAAIETPHRPELDAKHLVMGFDYPGYASKSGSFIPYFYDLLKKAEKQVLTEQQYFLPTSAIANVLHVLSEKKVSVEILTNSFMSGDDPLIDDITTQRAVAYNRMPGVRIALFKGQLAAQHWGFWRAGLEKTRWQIHSKAVVIDDRSSWIGSNNLDSRSERFSLETGVLVEGQPELAKELSESIRAGFQESFIASPDEPEITQLSRNAANLPFWDYLSFTVNRFSYRFLEVFL